MTDAPRGMIDAPRGMTDLPRGVAEIALCDDDTLGYRRARTVFAPGQGLALDEAYRLAHLPLVAPGHPRAIASRPDRPYRNGRHPPVHSLVLPVPAEALEASPAYRALNGALRAAPFADRIAWDVLPRRHERLHATLCGSLDLGPGEPALDEARRGRLAALGPFTVDLRGVFSGTVNVGRLYLRAYPERRDGVNLMHAVQAAMGARPTDLALVGLWNLTDDLDAAEAAALDALITAWWDRPVLRFTVNRLWLLTACDDLVLDASHALVPLTA